MGASLWLLCKSLTEANPSQLPQVISAFCLSWIIGFLSFLTPAGLGVREGALAFLLQPSFPLFAAAALALLSRVWWILGDVLAWILSIGWGRWVKVRGRNDPERKGIQMGILRESGDKGSLKI